MPGRMSSRSCANSKKTRQEFMMVARTQRPPPHRLTLAWTSCPVGGALTAWTDEGRLARLDMVSQAQAKARMQQWRGAWSATEWVEGVVPAAHHSALETGAYQAIPLLLCGTEFQTQIWRLLLKIPHGQTVSYGEIARRSGRPQAARAVGQAVGRNPIALIVPCHRVIAGNGGIGGYAGGLPMKRRLLAAESVTIDET